MATYPARPTVYNGIQMRSRLEATFAGFLDEAGFEWSYEPRAYGSGRAQYLPDFEVTFSGIAPIFFEIKGNVRGSKLERLVILRRMEIILASEPDARLVVIEDAWFAQGQYSFPIRDRLHPINDNIGWGDGRFALCRCGSTYITAVPRPSTHPIPIPLDDCHRCGANGSVLAWLDPTSRRA